MKMDQFIENDAEKKTKHTEDKSKIDLSDTETGPVEDENFSPPQLHGKNFSFFFIFLKNVRLITE